MFNVETGVQRPGRYRTNRRRYEDVLDPRTWGTLGEPIKRQTPELKDDMKVKYEEILTNNEISELHAPCIERSQVQGERKTIENAGEVVNKINKNTSTDYYRSLKLRLCYITWNIIVQVFNVTIIVRALLHITQEVLLPRKSTKLYKSLNIFNNFVLKRNSSITMILNVLYIDVN